MKLFALLTIAGVLTVAPSLSAETKQEQKEISSDDSNLLIWKWANFAVLMGILFYFGAKYGNPYFQGRTKVISSELETARARQADAEQRSKDVQRRLANLGAEIENFRTQALAEQKAHAEELRRRLDAELERIHNSSMQQIESIAKQERFGLQRDASRLALELAERRLRSEMNPELQRTLVGQFVEHIEA